LVTTLPELSGRGRDRIRVRDVLTHQTGFPSLATSRDLVSTGWADGFARAIEVPGDGPIEPGRAACYQEWRYWYLLGELITRLTGRSVPDVVRSEVLQPLGLDKEIVLGRDAVEARDADRLGYFEPPDGLRYWACPHTDPQQGWRGGTNTFGSVRAIAALLAALPGGPDFHPGGVFHDLPTVGAAWRTGIPDRYFSCVRDWGLGVMLESSWWGRPSLVFSRLAAQSTYGHVARGAIAAFVDPVHRLTAGVLGSGQLNTIEARYYIRSACTAIYRELGIAR
jgi:CubicO group peptidase (beta-lactamase class C family)